MAAEPWPDIPEEHRWATDLVEKQLQRSKRTPEELRARARELRTQATETQVRGVQRASLALAERYDEAAAARLVSQ
jgi:hypothetical protein